MSWKSTVSALAVWFTLVVCQTFSIQQHFSWFPAVRRINRVALVYDAVQSRCWRRLVVSLKRGNNVCSSLVTRRMSLYRCSVSTFSRSSLSHNLSVYH